MYPYDPYPEPAVPPPPLPPLEAAPAVRRRRWLLPAVLALAFLLTLGVGVFMGAALLANAQAAAGGQNGAKFARFSLANTPGAHGSGGPGGQGQRDAYTVASVSGNTIAAKAADGSTLTIHTSSSTKYTKGGQSASASAVTAGSQIHVEGAYNSDGSITATQIDVR
jgi:uncharacterized protein DUF5666